MMNHNLHKPYPTTNMTRRRTHLKPSQVAVLQESFVTNTLPDASMRAQLAQELAISERTVQIWFQNRRAKARKLEAGGGLPSLVPNVRTGWIDMPQPTQTTFRSFITPECYENEPTIKRRPRSSSKPEKTTSFIVPTPPPRAMSEGMGRLCETKDTSSLVSFPVNTIRIGSWARFASQVNNEWDLVCFSDPTSRMLIWQVQDDGHQFRIEVNYNNIKQIKLGKISNDMGQLEIDVEPSISFSMTRQGIDQDWIRCGDFTENQQATEGTSHALQGAHDNLRQSLLELISQAPDLAGKLVIVPDTDFLCRDMTVSPSATPEPISQYFNNSNNHFMLEKNWNNYYPPYDIMPSWSYLNMLQQQNNSFI
ncbi:hypothetical protein EDC94DRAFT_625104 [Helicostylum pulchrum]|uniref:Homeobox domain-containing protein n=1 Tax=Helicostylum pulchrum TaxID=562976 RepID=A0ABP9YDC1_9FUNG|nr:hypothetical protein EDC94DRAFT_625104 [Helicostylum pulchrum]